MEALIDKELLFALLHARIQNQAFQCGKGFTIQVFPNCTYKAIQNENGQNRCDFCLTFADVGHSSYYGGWFCSPNCVREWSPREYANWLHIKGHYSPTIKEY